MHVGFDCRRYHLPRVMEARMIVDHEILGEQLEHHAIILQLDVHGAVDGAIDVPLLDFAGTAKIHAAAAVSPARGEPTHARYNRFDRRLGHGLSFFYSCEHAVRYRLM